MEDQRHETYDLMCKLCLTRIKISLRQARQFTYSDLKFTSNHFKD